MEFKIIIIIFNIIFNEMKFMKLKENQRNVHFKNFHCHQESTSIN